MIFTRQDHETLAGILAEAGRREVMPRFRNLAAGEIREKRSATDLVTEADEAAERFISAELARAFPGAVLIGEEAVAADPALVERLGDAELAVVIDPIDGTLNYASDLPLFAVMAAVLVRGEVVAAVIHDPIVEDSAMALRGEGAWLGSAGGKTRDLRVAPAAAPREMTGMMSWQYFPEPLRSKLPGHMPAFANVSSLRCCGHEYRLAAAGNGHFLLYGRLSPWDHAPGSLIYAEAGGHVRMLDGEPYRPAQPTLGLLCAPDAESWQEIRTILLS
ncbi:fructose-1,6-bisphosphatase/inositol monophosphatase family enzyme [Bosea sp. BE125]|uniref:inositol monophosphatase family protein n=1 Tax=Bosea sp. BE125 TaxID=2817909 RepID=UPI002859E34B|nr:inositol monophosphatase family protein [Bosea sp. BE125]MDR6872060.1 fructose-1,6-bisphosphatase/inositol monophosphatase family enzyme [Bosea sp. BE125]